MRESHIILRKVLARAISFVTLIIPRSSTLKLSHKQHHVSCIVEVRQPSNLCLNSEKNLRLIHCMFMMKTCHIHVMCLYCRNPLGRTGCKGRGTLGRWGPNHAADPIVTRLVCIYYLPLLSNLFIFYFH